MVKVDIEAVRRRELQAKTMEALDDLTPLIETRASLLARDRYDYLFVCDGDDDCVCVCVRLCMCVIAHTHRYVCICIVSGLNYVYESLGARVYTVCI